MDISIHSHIMLLDCMYIIDSAHSFSTLDRFQRDCFNACVIYVEHLRGGS